MQDHEDTINTRSQDYNIIVKNFGDVAGTKDYFSKGDPTLLEPVITGLQQASDFARDVSGRLTQIASDLAAAWQGQNADDAVQIVKLLAIDANTISANTAAVSASIEDFLDNTVIDNVSAKGLVGVRAMVLGLSDDDLQGACDAFQAFVDMQNLSMHRFPNKLVYHDPLSGAGGDSFTPSVPDGGGGGGINVGDGLGVGGGAGLDTGSHLAGLGSGVGTSAGLGGSAGLGSGASGGADGFGAEGDGTGGAGQNGMMAPPMMGGGRGGEEQDRQRTTWLEEDEDVWGSQDAGPSVIG